MTPRKGEVWWPPYKQQDQFDRSLKRGDSPNDNWVLYPVERFFFEEQDYSKAAKKIKKAEVTSDLTSGDEILSKRRRLAPKRLFSSSSSSDEEPPVKIKGLSNIVSRKVKADSRGVCVTAVPYRTSSQLTQACEQQELPLVRENNVYLQTSEGLLPTLTGSQPEPNEGSKGESCLLRENNAYLKKSVALLASIKAQTDQILNILSQRKTATGCVIDMPQDVPVSLPVKQLHELVVFEKYLENETKFSTLVSYFSTIGGRDLKCKVNAILRQILTNNVASSLSFLGSRNGKKPFCSLKLIKLITRTENEINDAIKVWLKHAPKRQAADKKKQDSVGDI
ncbi:unnamed protein product [Callosobruchus maculatus]|uniref:Uncharacterized protein n=1 Tax=Callosobruchus maculatus TaxID=64391 RepID=A0A653BDT1_CALMS|nr:unnamed protein product [Callosobruchus maculatus]VEN59553.1 unnamed protein product [Callosobruchus maculatus]